MPFFFIVLASLTSWNASADLVNDLENYRPIYLVEPVPPIEGALVGLVKTRGEMTEFVIPERFYGKFGTIQPSDLEPANEFSLPFPQIEFWDLSHEDQAKVGPFLGILRGQLKRIFPLADDVQVGFSGTSRFLVTEVIPVRIGSSGQASERIGFFSKALATRYPRKPLEFSQVIPGVYNSLDVLRSLLANEEISVVDFSMPPSTGVPSLFNGAKVDVRHREAFLVAAMKTLLERVKNPGASLDPSSVLRARLPVGRHVDDRLPPVADLVEQYFRFEVTLSGTTEDGSKPREDKVIFRIPIANGLKGGLDLVSRSTVYGLSLRLKGGFEGPGVANPQPLRLIFEGGEGLQKSSFPIEIALEAQPTKVLQTSSGAAAVFGPLRVSIKNQKDTMRSFHFLRKDGQRLALTVTLSERLDAEPPRDIQKQRTVSFGNSCTRSLSERQ